MASSDVNVKGMKELHEALQTLPVKLERNVMRAAINAGARVLRDEARMRAPVKSGELRAGIRVKSSNVKNGTITGGITTAGTKAKPGAWYAHFVEFGTAAHVIRAKPGKFLAFGGGLYTQVNHPGARAQPFMRPALDAKGQAAVQAVADKVRSALSTKHGIDVPVPDGGEE